MRKRHRARPAVAARAGARIADTSGSSAFSTTVAALAKIRALARAYSATDA